MSRRAVMVVILLISLVLTFCQVQNANAEGDWDKTDEMFFITFYTKANAEEDWKNMDKVLFTTFIQDTSTGGDWDKLDKALFITYSICQLALLGQANYIFEDEEYGAYKPFLTARRKLFLPVYYAGSVLGAGYLADKVTPLRRKLLLSAFILISVDIISDNMRIGIGFAW